MLPKNEGGPVAAAEVTQASKVCSLRNANLFDISCADLQDDERVFDEAALGLLARVRDLCGIPPAIPIDRRYWEAESQRLGSDWLSILALQAEVLSAYAVTWDDVLMSSGVEVHRHERSDIEAAA